MTKPTTLPGRQSYITRSNKYVIKKVNGKQRVRKLKKRGKATSCGDCKKTLAGISAKRPAAFKRLKKSKRTVARAYGGVLCGKCVETRIITSFLNQEDVIKSKLKGEAN
ncbi:hypothetical protein EDEG_02599 [Edhazardia aedis USNM 41457]|uniref:60S ribosomal protein L34 n=1 Tax=Edhazardia aedis (strain USNM 41457) TaxID=1003232 RepID=J9DNR4_EDHAE|nr:hypothetical protein EDEG_02599 [Edhazardia aedis USNM 41457]|eukprot:EJW03017.1 hypothetical protein EDEG_02599 [Edhazardia aedis USNM 41457]